MTSLAQCFATATSLWHTSTTNAPCMSLLRELFAEVQPSYTTGYGPTRSIASTFRTHPAVRESTTRSFSLTAALSTCAMRPNPSLKRTANGRPPSPDWRCALHFHRPGHGELPSPPA